MIARVVLVAVAVLAIALLGFWTRATVLEDRAQTLATDIFAQADARQARLALDRFEAAGRHNPDTRPDVLRANFLLRLRMPGEAAQVLGPVVNDEPENIDAVALLAASLARSDPPQAERLRERRRRLNPLGLGN